MTVTRSDTNPGWLGCVNCATWPPPTAGDTVAACQVAPSFTEYCRVSVRSPAAAEPGCGAARNGIVNGCPADAVLPGSRAGAIRTDHNGSRSGTSPLAVCELNVHRALIRVLSSTGAPRWAVAVSWYVPNSGGTASSSRPPLYGRS